MNIARALGLTAEETSALCHMVGVALAAAFGVRTVVTGTWHVTLMDVLLIGGLIAGGVWNDKLNTPAPTAGSNGEPK